nr:immunoglobulin heavy chain junction region [Mus musculus]
YYCARPYDGYGYFD